MSGQQTSISEAVERWLESRGIDPELAEAYGWRSAPGRNNNVLCIPYYMRGRVVARKYRSIIEKKFWQDERPKRCFWNFDALADATTATEPVVITEGEIDAILAIQAGYPVALSVPDGAPDHEISFEEEGAKYDFLVDAYQLLKSRTSVILATDGDDPGACLFHDILSRIGASNVKFVKYPHGCKDLGDVCKKHGIAKVKEVLDGARWVEIDDVRRMSELPPLPPRRSFPGLDWLSDHYRVRFGDLCVVTGIPSMGKTTFVNDLVCTLAQKYDWTIGMFSPEQEPQTDCRRNLLTWRLGCPPQDCSPADRDAALDWIDKHFVFVCQSEKSDDKMDLRWVTDRIMAAKLRYGIRVFVIDPWNELEHSMSKDEFVTDYVGKSLRKLKRLSRDLDIHMIVVAHPKKLQAINASKGPTEPTLYDISDSANWYNKCDVGIVVHKGSINVVKTKYHDQIGRPGKVKVEFNSNTARFQEAVDQEQT